MSEASSTFASLLERSRQGDQAALQQLIDQYEPKIRMVARMALGPSLRPYLDSVDLVQSVHRSLMMGLRQDKFDIATPENLIGLVLTMVRRKVARQWRRLQRQTRLDADTQAGQNLPDLLVSLTSPQDDPARTAQFKDQIKHLCQNLSDAERHILDLRLEGYSTAEIAAKVGLSGVALRVRLTRLKQRLQEIGAFDDWL